MIFAGQKEFQMLAPSWGHDGAGPHLVLRHGGQDMQCAVRSRSAPALPELLKGTLVSFEDRKTWLQERRAGVTAAIGMNERVWARNVEVFMKEQSLEARRMVECMSQQVGFSYWTPLERRMM